MSEGAFFRDLAILMTAAGLISVLFTRFGWPKVIGYIFGGIALGGYTWGGSFLSSTETVQTIGQLGVVFLMFSMGLWFSAREMKRLRTVAVPVALVDTIVMTWLGYTAGTRVFGWGAVPSLFLGAAICDSSTTMLAKVIGEMRASDRPFVRFAIGSSVCEDIVCVGMIALVTGVALGGGMSVSGAALSIGGLVVFILATLVFGMIFIPRLLVSVGKTGDPEALILTALGCLFFVSTIAYQFHFSLAIGAFLVGVIVAASDVRRKISELFAPLRSMFAAVFFVSIGLLIDPLACGRHLPAIILVSLLVIVGKFLNVTFAALLAGERVKTAVQMGMALAQIGEFAFMVALLYASTTGDWQSPLYQIVVAVSLLTTILNPFMIRASEAVASRIEARIPVRIKNALDEYHGMVVKFRETTDVEGERLIIRRAVTVLAVTAGLTFAVSTVCGALHHIDYTRFAPWMERYDWVVFFLAANLFALSMLPMILRSARQLGEAIGRILAGGEAKWMETVRHATALGVTIAVLVLYFAEVVMINVNLTPSSPLAGGVVTLILVAAAVFGWRFFKKTGSRAVTRFNEALGAEERLERLERMMAYKVPEGLVTRLVIGPQSIAVGSSVISLDIRARTGASVVAVERGGETIRTVGSVIFEPGDVLIAMGGGAELAALKELLAKSL